MTIADAIATSRRTSCASIPLERPAEQKNLDAIVYTVIAGDAGANLEDGRQRRRRRRSRGRPPAARRLGRHA
jgi:hypothetical protein